LAALDGNAAGRKGCSPKALATIAYSYTRPRNHLADLPRMARSARRKKTWRRAASDLDAALAKKLGGHAWVSCNKAVVTAMPPRRFPSCALYLSLLPVVMRGKKLDEGPLEQMRRLFTDFLCAGGPPKLDDAETPAPG